MIEAAQKEVAANAAKLSRPDPSALANVSEYDVSVGGAIETEQVWVQVTTEYGDAGVKRACFAERGERTPQINEEIAVTGFGGTVWWCGRIFAIHKPMRKRKSPTFLVDVIYPGPQGCF